MHRDFDVRVTLLGLERGERPTGDVVVAFLELLLGRENDLLDERCQPIMISQPFVTDLRFFQICEVLWAQNLDVGL